MNNTPCSSCIHACVKRGSTDLFCAKHEIDITTALEDNCFDYLSSHRILGTPDAYSIREAFQQHCSNHNNCSGCPYWNLHDHDLCVINFTINYLKK